MRIFDTKANQRTIRAMLSEEDLTKIVVDHVLKAAGSEDLEITGHDKTQVFFQREQGIGGTELKAEVTITIDLDQRDSAL